MYCVCYVCSQQYRIKAPFDDPSISHGLCEECLPGELLRMERETVAFGALQNTIRFLKETDISRRD